MTSHTLTQTIEALPKSAESVRLAVRLYQIQKQQQALNAEASCAGAQCFHHDDMACTHCIIAKLTFVIYQQLRRGEFTIGEVLHAYILQYSPEEITEALL